jgi:hypothetical protein
VGKPFDSSVQCWCVTPSQGSFHHVISNVVTDFATSSMVSCTCSRCRRPTVPPDVIGVSIPCIYYGRTLYWWGSHGLRPHTISPVRSSRRQVGPQLFLHPDFLCSISLSVGLLYLWSANSIRKGAPYAVESALGKCVFTHIRTSNYSRPPQVLLLFCYSPPSLALPKGLFQSCWWRLLLLLAYII